MNNSKNFNCMMNGSTVILVHINSEKIISSNCGDSRAILITKNNKIILLSRDHKPEIPEEEERIEKSGGEIYKTESYEDAPYRVFKKGCYFPGIAMSRSIGDTMAHQYSVSDIPEIKEFNIKEVEPLAIVLASDGVWGHMTNNEVKYIINNFAENKDANKCAKKIVKQNIEKWDDFSKEYRDDITCIVIFFSLISFPEN